MTDPIYYTNAYQDNFTATVQEQWQENGRFAYILSQTAFYPDSGGQPSDSGTLNNTAVIDLTFRKEDNAIIHWLETPLEANTPVNGQINWSRRFDHMQQHTGQHMLSQAFIQLANAYTVSFHLSPKSVTIDLDAPTLSDQKVGEVEAFVNQIVWENRPINIKFVTLAEAHALNVRKLPPTSRDKIRLVDITDFDLTACGGTHVLATGAVGIIKIIKVERQNKKTRVTFACGQRALTDYAEKNEVTIALTQTLTTGLEELVPNIGKLQNEIKQLQKEKKLLQNTLIPHQAAEIAETAVLINNHRLIIHMLSDGDSGTLRTLAQHLTQTNHTIALLALVANNKTQLLFSCADDVPFDMSHLLKETTSYLGNGSGGGKKQMAQGGTSITTIATIQNALQHVANELLSRHQKASE